MKPGQSSTWDGPWATCAMLEEGFLCNSRALILPFFNFFFLYCNHIEYPMGQNNSAARTKPQDWHQTPLCSISFLYPSLWLSLSIMINSLSSHFPGISFLPSGFREPVVLWALCSRHLTCLFLIYIISHAQRCNCLIMYTIFSEQAQRKI